MDSFIDLFQLREDSGKEHHQPTSMNDGLKILKGTADFMKEIEVQARARTGRRCPQGPDLRFTKPTRDSFQMLHSSFVKIKSILDDKGLLHIAEVIDFSSFTTLQIEHFLAGMRTPSRPTPDMHDYASRWPNCIIESLQKNYQSSSLFTVVLKLTTSKRKCTKKNLNGSMNAVRQGLCILWKRVIKPWKRLRSLGFSPKSLDKELDSKG